MNLHHRKWTWVHCCLIHPLIRHVWFRAYHKLFCLSTTHEIHFHQYSCTCLLHYSFYSSHCHISEKLNKKMLFGSLQSPLLLHTQGAKGTNIVWWMQDWLEPSQCSTSTFLYSSFSSLLSFFQSNINSCWYCVVSVSQKVYFPITWKQMFDKFTIAFQISRWCSVKTHRTLNRFCILIANLTLPKRQRRFESH